MVHHTSAFIRPQPNGPSSGGVSSFSFSKIWNKVAAFFNPASARVHCAPPDMRAVSDNGPIRLDNIKQATQPTVKKTEKNVKEITPQEINKIITQADMAAKYNLSIRCRALKALFNPAQSADFSGPTEQAAENIYKLAKLTSIIGVASTAVQEDIKNINEFMDSNVVEYKNNYTMVFTTRQKEIGNAIQSFLGHLKADNSISSTKKEVLSLFAKEAIKSIELAEPKNKHTAQKKTKQLPPDLNRPRSDSSPGLQFRPASQIKPKPVSSFTGAKLEGDTLIKNFENIEVKRKLDKELKYAEEEMNNEKPDERFELVSSNVENPTKIGKEIFSVENFKAGIASTQGKRSSMEDAHDACLLKLELNGKSCNVPYFSVFDGHGGSEASQFAKENMPKILQETLRDSSESGIWNALKQACVRLDKAFNEAKPDHDTVGTTAVFSLVIGGKLWTANVGDSRAILVRKDKSIPLTCDAKPDAERFKQSVKDQGGRVLYGRVHGISYERGKEGGVAVARAIGDAWAKGVSAEPEITCISDWNPKTDKLILACDGPFEVASRKQVADLVRKNGNKFMFPMSPQDNAKSVIEHAAASRDNMTVMVVEGK